MPARWIYCRRRPGQRYLVDIRNKCEVLVVDLLDLPLHSISPEQVKAGLSPESRVVSETQLDCAMRILRSIWVGADQIR